jgi:hypothetical protein
MLVDGEALLGLVKAALSRIDQREIHQIRTHPQTVRLLEEALRQTNNGRRIEISADSRLDGAHSSWKLPKAIWMLR